MTQDKMAKNLLSDRTCDNCYHSFNGAKQVTVGPESDICQRTGIPLVFPKNRICKHWLESTIPHDSR
jgi:hypothetical protein